MGRIDMIRISKRWFSTSVDPKEVNTFSKVRDWWNPYGKMAPLLSYNKARVAFVMDTLRKIENSPNLTNLKGRKIIDIGCGGGLSTESFARLGANVVGIDVTPTSIEIAKAHLQEDSSIKDLVEYIQTSVEEYSETKPSAFDILTAFEVIEHVANVDSFVAGCLKLVKPGGLIFLSSINQTNSSWLSVIVAAEYIFNVVERGTHDWNKFISPDRLNESLRRHGAELIQVKGLQIDVLSGEMKNSQSLDTHYMMSLRKVI
eukprot:TRINITY_DN8204_c0_g1_i1.p1 TRINITY_DN8204_c0_g1~~TRINITY_DN8204_c0_g1_i1.p1  ORF type:complete len:292 (-),score=54.18 TRINITY_DN8204_c0_g1_i1:20-796(-)